MKDMSVTSFSAAAQAFVNFAEQNLQLRMSIGAEHWEDNDGNKFSSDDENICSLDEKITP
jgi:hypothetical protein